MLGGLFDKPYRVVHLAGHGHYEPPNTPGGRAKSGMVLDNGVFLTAVEIGQMQQVPELVFLNCCFIGQVGPQQPSLVTGIQFNRLAASMSRELIEMGVRAIVAAGWAVRDDAALHFARVFYEQMLAGARFGNALREARQETWAKYRECNTWGAYQAYGDPDFQLDPSGALAGRREADGYVSEAELLDRLEVIRRGASESSKKAADTEAGRSSTATQIDDLIKKSPAEWLERSEILLALGATYGEAGNFDPAARYLKAALELETRTMRPPCEPSSSSRTSKPAPRSGGSRRPKCGRQSSGSKACSRSAPRRSDTHSLAAPTSGSRYSRRIRRRRCSRYAGQRTTTGSRMNAPCSAAPLTRIPPSTGSPCLPWRANRSPKPDSDPRAGGDGRA